MFKTRRASAAVGLSFALVVAGCGGTGFASRTDAPAPKPPTPKSFAVVHDPVLQAVVVHAVVRTAAQHSARTSISVTLTGLHKATLATGAFDVAGSGVVDLTSGDADLMLSVPRFDRISGGGGIEARIVGGVVYTKMPTAVLRAGGMPASVHWLSLQPARVQSGDPSVLSQAQVDPAGALAFLSATSADVRRIGTEPVRGVVSTHYAATIDLAHLVGAAARVQAVRTELARLGATITAHRIGIDVWVDAAGRARRVVVSVPISGTDALGADAMMRIQGDFYGFGVRVRVAAPPQAQVRPYSALRIADPSG